MDDDACRAVTGEQVEVVADDDDRDVVAGSRCAEQRHDGIGGRGVQCGGGLVADQHIRVESQCASDGYALALAAGQLVGPPVGEFRSQVDCFEGGSDGGGAGRVVLDAAPHQRAVEDLADGALRIQGRQRVLRHQLDPGTGSLIAAMPGHRDLVVAEKQLSGRGGLEARQDACEGGFARTGFAEYGCHVTERGVDSDILQYGSPGPPQSYSRCGETTSAHIGFSSGPGRLRYRAGMSAQVYPLVGQSVEGGVVVTGDEYCPSVVTGEFVQQAGHDAASVDVQAGERLVDDQDRCATQQGSGESDPPLLAAGQLAAPAPQQCLGQPDL